MKSFSKNYGIKMYSIHNEKKSVIAEKFIKNYKIKIKNKNYKYITSISKEVYIDKLDDIVNKYNNTNSTIKMTSIDVKSSTRIESSKEIK